MSRDFPESDWKVFKELRAVALERFCQRITDEVAAIASAAEGTAHERYLKIYTHIREADKQVARAFNDFSRSTAFIQIYIINSLNVWTEQEIGRFSQGIQDRIKALEPINDRNA